MSPELTLNLLFSATLPLMRTAPDDPKPIREVRIAHNHARRLLAELYGYEESKRLFESQEVRLEFHRHPPFLTIGLPLFGLSTLYGLFFRSRH